MPPLSSEEFGAGRQIQREDDTLDVLGVLSDGSGTQFAVVTTGDMGGLAALIPVSLLREEESEFQAIDPSEREERQRQAEEERVAKEEADKEEFRQWQASQEQGEQPPAPAPAQGGGGTPPASTSI